jgi:hypothetical protein
VNSFDRPDVITPRASDVVLRGAPLVYTFSPASVTKIEFALGG